MKRFSLNQIALVIASTSIFVWATATYCANARQTEVGSKRFAAYLEELSEEKSVEYFQEIVPELQRLRVMLGTTGGVKNGWNHLIPLAIFGAGLLLVSVGSGFVRQTKKKTEQEEAADASPPP